VKLGFPALKLPRIRLYQQIIICFVLIVFIPLVSVSVLIFNINQKALKKELTLFTEHTAEALYKDLETETSWQSDQIRVLHYYLMDRLTLTHDFDGAAQGLFQLGDTYEAVALYDAQGQYVKAAYRNFPHLSPELRLPAKLKPKDTQMQAGQKLKLSVQYPNTGDPQENTYYLRALMPLESGPYKYYVILKRFPFLQKLIKDQTKTLHTNFYIVGSDGEILAGPSESELWKQTLPAEELSFLRRIPNGVTRKFEPQNANTAGVIDEETGKKNPLEKVFVKMPDIGWGVIIESPYSVRQVYVKRARDQSLMMIVGSLVLILALTLFYTLGINRNFRQLIKAIKAMAEGNYARRIRLISNTTTPMEIVYLTGEFNRMARRMAEAWKNSQDLNQELMRRNEQEAFLSQITKQLHGKLTLDEIGELTSETLGHYLRSNSCVMVHFGQASEDQPTDQQASHHPQAWAWSQLPSKDSSTASEPNSNSPDLAAQAFRADITASPQWLNHPILMGNHLIQPITYQTQCLGYLYLTREPDDTTTDLQGFQAEETHLVQLVANQVGVALHQAQQWQTIQEANAKLAKLDEFKSNLIDTVSHELRTPLTSIKGYTSRLLRFDSNLSAEMKTQSLKVIKQQADRLSRLVEDLLVIPDLDKMNLRVFPDKVALPELIDRSVQFIQEKAHREILINWPSQTVPAILADPDRLEQVLLNLLDNAVKYSIEDTSIQVVVLPADISQNRVILVISNESPPMTEQNLSSLFEKFKRLDDSLTRTTRGSGLGLFITKGLVEAMGGDIQLGYHHQRFEVRVSLPIYQDDSKQDDLKALAPDQTVSLT
jgi:signal transduction histidine kinase